MPTYRCTVLVIITPDEIHEVAAVPFDYEGHDPSAAVAFTLVPRLEALVGRPIGDDPWSHLSDTTVRRRLAEQATRAAQAHVGSRGGLVDIAATVEAVERGLLALAEEPPAYSPRRTPATQPRY